MLLNSTRAPSPCHSPWCEQWDTERCCWASSTAISCAQRVTVMYCPRWLGPRLWGKWAAQWRLQGERFQSLLLVVVHLEHITIWVWDIPVDAFSVISIWAEAHRCHKLRFKASPAGLKKKEAKKWLSIQLLVAFAIVGTVARKKKKRGGKKPGGTHLLRLLAWLGLSLGLLIDGRASSAVNNAGEPAWQVNSYGQGGHKGQHCAPRGGLCAVPCCASTARLSCS